MAYSDYAATLRTRNGIAYPSPAILGRIANPFFSIFVSGPSRIENTKFLTNTASTV